jgi:hypothetical protein
MLRKALSAVRWVLTLPLRFLWRALRVFMAAAVAGLGGGLGGLGPRPRNVEKLDEDNQIVWVEQADEEHR